MVPVQELEIRKQIEEQMAETLRTMHPVNYLDAALKHFRTPCAARCVQVGRARTMQPDKFRRSARTLPMWVPRCSGLALLEWPLPVGTHALLPSDRTVRNISGGTSSEAWLLKKCRTHCIAMSDAPACKFSPLCSAACIQRVPAI